MAVEVTHLPALVTFAGSSTELDPIRMQLNAAAISFEETEQAIIIDLHAQGEGHMAIQKGAFVWDLVDLYLPEEG